MPNTICPKCSGKKDRRAVHCRKCQTRNRPAQGKSRKLEKIGYVYVMIDGKCVYEHRYVMEKYLGRKLSRSEHVHHINHDKTDNRIENLEVLAGKDHHKRHMTSEKAKEISLLGHAARWGGKNSYL